MKKRFSEEQIVGFLKEAERGVAVKDLCRRLGSKLLPLAKQVRRARSVRSEASEGARDGERTPQEARGAVDAQNEISREALRKKW